MAAVDRRVQSFVLVNMYLTCVFLFSFISHVNTAPPLANKPKIPEANDNLNNNANGGGQNGLLNQNRDNVNQLYQGQQFQGVAQQGHLPQQGGFQQNVNPGAGQAGAGVGAGFNQRNGVQAGGQQFQGQNQGGQGPQEIGVKVPEGGFNQGAKAGGQQGRNVMLSNHPACVDDIAQLCDSTKLRLNNFAVLDCLQQDEETLVITCIFLTKTNKYKLFSGAYNLQCSQRTTHSKLNFV